MQMELQKNVFNTLKKSFHVHSSTLASGQAVPATQDTLLIVEPVREAEVNFSIMGFVFLSACLFFDDLNNFKSCTEISCMDMCHCRMEACCPAIHLIYTVDLKNHSTIKSPHEKLTHLLF